MLERSPQESLEDISEMRRQLDGLEETEEMVVIMKHLSALKEILSSGIKKRKLFIILDEEVVKLVAKPLPEREDAIITDLYARVNKIYECVNMDVSSRMILDAVLLALSDMVSTGPSAVAILPDARIGSNDGIPVINPPTGFELHLSGNTDYAVIKYDVENDNKAFLLYPGGYPGGAFRVAKGRFFLIEAKQYAASEFPSFVPEAVGQAIALLKSSNYVRFCLSDGRQWIFFVLRMVDSELTYYYSLTRMLNTTAALRVSDVQLREIMFLLREWLDPTTTGLFDVEE
ncbi:hypothetical protein BDQ12DRAFT_705188 [Crucibulum laeve]|uniref:Uncharacterized protein n=1 Tax=Crucibulum laeve TaxID=68775 RepID=A0A5C3M1Z2_9AGAR|nr:hypothetical protein BDQ12DRAFT_705188 [Crucibulum laeve]